MLLLHPVVTTFSSAAPGPLPLFEWTVWHPKAFPFEITNQAMPALVCDPTNVRTSLFFSLSHQSNLKEHFTWDASCAKALSLGSSSLEVPYLAWLSDIRASVLFYCHVPWKRSFILLLEGRQMKLVLEYKVNPISESIAHGQMISVLSTLSERFPLSKLIINCWKNEGLLLCFMSLCSTPMLNAFHFLWQNSFSIDKVALRVFTGLCKHPHMAKLK